MYSIALQGHRKSRLKSNRLYANVKLERVNQESFILSATNHNAVEQIAHEYA